MICSSCGSRLALSEGLCGACMSYVESAASAPRPMSPKALERASRDLAELPALTAELARCLTERGAPTEGHSGKVTGSPAPMRLDVLHLIDEHEKPLWWGEDPRVEDMQDRYGVTYQLAAWVRVLWEEMPDAEYPAEQPTVTTESAYLLAAWPWISMQPWADELCTDITRLAGQVRSALGIRREYRPKCRYCHNTVTPVDADGQSATWDTCAYGRCTGCDATFAPGPELATLGKVQQPMTLGQVAETTGIAKTTLREWRDREWIRPATESDGRVKGRYDLAEVVAVRDRVTQ